MVKIDISTNLHMINFTLVTIATDSHSRHTVDVHRRLTGGDSAEISL